MISKQATPNLKRESDTKEVVSVESGTTQDNQESRDEHKLKKEQVVVC